MIETIITLLGSPLLGGVVGTIGSYLGKKEDRKTLELTYSHEQKMASILSENRRKELTTEGIVAEKTLEAEAFLTSQKMGNQNSGNSILDGLKSLVRPFITLYLLIIVSIIGFDLYNIVEGLKGLSSIELVSLYRELIVFTLSLCGLAVSWWFGNRGSSLNTTLRTNKEAP